MTSPPEDGPSIDPARRGGGATLVENTCPRYRKGRSSRPFQGSQVDRADQCAAPRPAFFDPSAGPCPPLSPFFTYRSNQASISATKCSLDSRAVYQCGSNGSITRRVVPPLPRIAWNRRGDWVASVPGLASSEPCTISSGSLILSAWKNAEAWS